MSAVSFDDAAASTLGVFFNHAARVAEGHAWFDELDGFVEAFTGGFDDADGGRIGAGKGAYVVCFVEVAVEAVVVEGDVEVDDVAFEEDALVRDAVADYFVDGGADRFREVDVVEAGRVGLVLDCETGITSAAMKDRLTFLSMQAL